MLNCIIVDDEEFSIEAIKKYIEMLPKLNIVGVYTSPNLALQQVIAQENVDILFMDVDMPDISGLELAQALRSKTRKLVFTTAHSKYAFEAYEVEGDAFLLKPFSFLKFTTTINRLFPTEIQRNINDNNLEDDYFLVKNKEEDLRIVKVRYKDVIAFESAANYIKIYLLNSKTLVAYLTIKDILDIIGTREHFKQFHRAFIISTNCINYIEKNVITMNNNLRIAVGESHKEEFANYLSHKLLMTSRR